MESLITTLTIDRETESLISTSQSYEEISSHTYSDNKFEEFLEMMADQFIKFKKAQRGDLDEEG